MSDTLLTPGSAKKNFAFQLLYNAVILIIPMIVSPYLTRTMGSTSLGIYTYTFSIAYYFVVLAMLGINRYGQRIIAQRRNDFIRLRATFWSLYFVHFASSILALVAYITYVFSICGSDKKIALVQSVYVFSAALDITWLFYGLEKFRLIALRNAAVKTVETVCIFALVKAPSDIGVYTVIMCISVCAGHVVMFPQVIAAIPPIKFSKDDMSEHIKPMLTLFAASVAFTLYTVFDKNLLGILSTKENVAFYEYSNKIVQIPMIFTGIMGTVLFPGACRYAADKNYEKLGKNFEYCIIVNSLIGFAAAFGLFSIADLFAVIYYGESFAECGEVMSGMCPLIIIGGLGDAVRQSYVYSLKMDAAMFKIQSLNAAVNIMISFLLIPILGIYGAVAGTICAETVGLLLELWICRKYLSMRNLLQNVVPFALIGAVMCAGVKFIGKYLNETPAALLIRVFAGAVIYLSFTLIYAGLFNGTLWALIRLIKTRGKRL